MTEREKSITPNASDLDLAIAAYVAGDDAASDELYRRLRGPVHAEARQFLALDNVDFDDVVQETIIAVLAYLRKNEGFSGNLVKFAVTVVRNRCRNLKNFHSRRPQVSVDALRNRLTSALFGNPLEALIDAEIRRLVQESLDELDPACRSLLHALYVQGIPCKEMIRPLGLKSVHGVYRRRSACLARMNRIVKKRLEIDSRRAGRNRRPAARRSRFRK